MTDTTYSNQVPLLLWFNDWNPFAYFYWAVLADMVRPKKQTGEEGWIVLADKVLEQRHSCRKVGSPPPSQGRTHCWSGTAYDWQSSQTQIKCKAEMVAPEDLGILAHHIWEVNLKWASEHYLTACKLPRYREICIGSINERLEQGKGEGGENNETPRSSSWIKTETHLPKISRPKLSKLSVLNQKHSCDFHFSNYL